MVTRYKPQRLKTQLLSRRKTQQSKGFFRKDLPKNVLIRQQQEEATKYDTIFTETQFTHINQVEAELNKVPVEVRKYMTFNIEIVKSDLRNRISTIENDLIRSQKKEDKYDRKDNRAGEKGERARQKGLNEGLNRLKGGELLSVGSIEKFASDLRGQARSKERARERRREEKKKLEKKVSKTQFTIKTKSGKIYNTNNPYFVPKGEKIDTVTTHYGAKEIAKQKQDWGAVKVLFDKASNPTTQLSVADYAKAKTLNVNTTELRTLQSNTNVYSNWLDKARTSTLAQADQFHFKNLPKILNTQQKNNILRTYETKGYVEKYKDLDTTKYFEKLDQLNIASSVGKPIVTYYGDPVANVQSYKIAVNKVTKFYSDLKPLDFRQDISKFEKLGNIINKRYETSQKKLKEEEKKLTKVGSKELAKLIQPSEQQLILNKELYGESMTPKEMKQLNVIKATQGKQLERKQLETALNIFFPVKFGIFLGERYGQNPSLVKSDYIKSKNFSVEVRKQLIIIGHELFDGVVQLVAFAATVEQKIIEGGINYFTPLALNSLAGRTDLNRAIVKNDIKKIFNSVYGVTNKTFKGISDLSKWIAKHPEEAVSITIAATVLGASTGLALTKKGVIKITELAKANPERAVAEAIFFFFPYGKALKVAAKVETGTYKVVDKFLFSKTDIATIEKQIKALESLKSLTRVQTQQLSSLRKLQNVDSDLLKAREGLKELDIDLKTAKISTTDYKIKVKQEQSKVSKLSSEKSKIEKKTFKGKTLDEFTKKQTPELYIKQQLQKYGLTGDVKKAINDIDRINKIFVKARDGKIFLKPKDKGKLLSELQGLHGFLKSIDKVRSIQKNVPKKTYEQFKIVLKSFEIGKNKFVTVSSKEFIKDISKKLKPKVISKEKQKKLLIDEHIDGLTDFKKSIETNLKKKYIKPDLSIQEAAKLGVKSSDIRLLKQLDIVKGDINTFKKIKTITLSNLKQKIKSSKESIKIGKVKLAKDLKKASVQKYIQSFKRDINKSKSLTLKQKEIKDFKKLLIKTKFKKLQSLQNEIKKAQDDLADTIVRFSEVRDDIRKATKLDDFLVEERQTLFNTITRFKSFIKISFKLTDEQVRKIDTIPDLLRLLESKKVVSIGKDKLVELSKSIKEVRDFQKKSLSKEAINKILTKPKSKEILNKRLKRFDRQINELKIRVKEIEATKLTIKSKKVRDRLDSAIKIRKAQIKQLEQTKQDVRKIKPKEVFTREQAIRRIKTFKEAKKVYRDEPVRITAKAQLTPGGFKIQTTFGDIIIELSYKKPVVSLKGSKKGRLQSGGFGLKVSKKPKAKIDNFTKLRDNTGKEFNKATKRNAILQRANRYYERAENLDYGTHRKLKQREWSQNKKKTFRDLRKQIEVQIKILDRDIAQLFKIQFLRMFGRLSKIDIQSQQRIQTDLQKVLKSLNKLELQLEQIKPIKPIPEKPPKKPTPPGKPPRLPTPKLKPPRKPIIEKPPTPPVKPPVRPPTRPPTRPPKRIPRIILPSKDFDSTAYQNRIIKYEGTYRERKVRSKPFHKRTNPVITKIIKLHTTRNRALKKVADLADRRTVRSIELKVVGVTKKKVKDIKLPDVLKKFNRKRTVGTPVLRLVEKTKHIADTPGEIRELRISKARKKRFVQKSKPKSKKKKVGSKSTVQSNKKKKKSSQIKKKTKKSITKKKKVSQKPFKRKSGRKSTKKKSTKKKVSKKKKN